MKQILHTRRVIIVEGKYDAARLAGITDADILMTDGFAIYSDAEKRTLLRRLAVARGLILLTDSDAAGFRIRTFLTNLAGEQNVLQAYVPAIPGKEARKAIPGKEGLLGVEGVPDEALYSALENALRAGPVESKASVPSEPLSEAPICYTDLYEWGLSGTAGAAAKKAALLKSLGLPPRLSKKELLAVLNSLYTRTQLMQALDHLDGALFEA